MSFLRMEPDIAQAGVWDTVRFRRCHQSHLSVLLSSCVPILVMWSPHSVPYLEGVLCAPSPVQTNPSVRPPREQKFHLDGDWLQLGDKPIPEPIMWPKSSSVLIGQARFT